MAYNRVHDLFYYAKTVKKSLYKNPINTREIGDIGENIACKFLIKNNYLIIDRNYRKKWGEIDIVASKKGILHFIEVKSINSKIGYRPEENVHEVKIKRLRRVIQTYLVERKYGLGALFEFHIAVVYMNTNTRLAKVSFMENVIL